MMMILLVDFEKSVHGLKQHVTNLVMIPSKYIALFSSTCFLQVLCTCF